MIPAITHEPFSLGVPGEHDVAYSTSCGGIQVYLDLVPADQLPGHGAHIRLGCANKLSAGAPTRRQGGAQMLTADDNDLLCREEGDTPMRQVMLSHRLPGEAGE